MKIHRLSRDGRLSSRSRHAPRRLRMACLLAFVLLAFQTCDLISDDTGPEASRELVLTGGQIVTVDPEFRIAEAMRIRGNRIVAVGSDQEVLEGADPQATRIDLKGKTVLPGLIDSHVHAPAAAVYEFDHPQPSLNTIADVLAYIRRRAEAVEPGEWIRLQQVFVTRLEERRFPTREELNAAAPHHPVIYRTGPDAALNSLALELSGIDRDFELPPGETGKVERDPETGEPTGILRGASHHVRFRESQRSPSFEEHAAQLRQLMRDYNAVGITSISDRSASDGGIALYQHLLDNGELTCRVYLYYNVNGQASLERVQQQIATAREHPLHEENRWLWLRGIKVFLDGGMLTGSAYMRQPWGVSEIYSITDPQYRGELKIPAERLYQISRLALENGLQMTAHSVGDGAVHALLAAYEEVNETLPVEPLRPCITHCNFMSREAIAAMARLGVVADLQPAWLYLDGATLLEHFGPQRTEYFQPYRSLFDAGVIVGGGSDHMQKIGSLRSVNPYNPFLGIWTVLTRQPRRLDEPLHPQQRITREEAIRLYTINNAFLTFEEKEKGSLEPGKLADFVILDRDILTCPIDEIREITVQQTYVDGKMVYAESPVRIPAAPSNEPRFIGP
jgi:predicted amidohydrolase YtcJ